MGWLKHSIWAIPLCIVAALVFLWVVKTPVLSSYMTRKMGVPVSIGVTNIWPSQTTIYRFSISNPQGYRSRTAFLASTTEIDYQWHNLFSNPAVIDEIRLDGITLDIELNDPLGKSSNWSEIIAGIPPSETGKRELIIHKVILTNLTVNIYGLGLTGKKQVKQFDRMEFDNIDSREGFPTKQLIQNIFGNTGLMQYFQGILNKTLNPANAIPKLNPFNF